jgi:predicted RNA polymerase sigma factor
MLLTDARRPARTTPDGDLVPLAEQDRDKWDRRLITEGTDLISRTLPRGQVGPYQLQAAIAAVHDEAEHVESTDWRQILALYGLLEQIAPNPMVTLNRAVAVAVVHGPAAGLDLFTTLESNKRMGRHHRLLATRAHLLELLGEHRLPTTGIPVQAHHRTNRCGMRDRTQHRLDRRREDHLSTGHQDRDLRRLFLFPQEHLPASTPADHDVQARPPGRRPSAPHHSVA